MIESGRRYADVVNQLVSASRALQELVVGMLTDHINNEIDNHHNEALDPATLDEIATAIRRAVRL
jgi:DNA-binding FrmR family transcriptional regulator